MKGDVVIKTQPGGLSHSVEMLVRKSGRYSYRYLAGPFDDLEMARAAADRCRSEPSGYSDRTASPSDAQLDLF